jgi:hypothetical protein
MHSASSAQSLGTLVAITQVAADQHRTWVKRSSAMLGTILLVVVILMLLGALPTWPHSRQWGYYPSGGVGLILLILVILLVLGRI